MFGPNEDDQINEEQFVNNWRGLQARISALEFFAVIDEDGSGTLDRAEFLEFWRHVKERGTSDDEIFVQLQLTELGEMWIGLDNGSEPQPEATHESERAISLTKGE